ncbi:MAG: hypothetical protein WC054_14140 [Candidatus Nanopelagicales bacterium]
MPSPATTQQPTAEAPKGGRKTSVLLAAFVGAALAVGVGYTFTRSNDGGQADTSASTTSGTPGGSSANTTGSSPSVAPSPASVTGTWVGYSTSGSGRIRQTVNLTENASTSITGTMESVSESGKSATVRVVGTRTGSEVRLDEVEWLTPQPSGWWLASMNMTLDGQDLAGSFSRLGSSTPMGLIDLSRSG